MAGLHFCKGVDLAGCVDRSVVKTVVCFPFKFCLTPCYNCAIDLVVNVILFLLRIQFYG